ncbi:YihY/virulence factor BrkB family protein [Wolbachia endosymbiont of Pentidionis agamae]|uniref:YihY/virulence factor BrkB family protein n=1 Tax=Wolbachia endosymbiont of Pentidionis agamae TaxID=3110435 RepID=UPI002FD687A0
MNKILKRIKILIYCLYQALIDTACDGGIEHAGYLSFLILLSLFPFLIVLMALASALANLLDQYNIGWLFITDNIPHEILASLMPRINEIISGPPQQLLTLAIVSSIWTASSAMEGIRTILNKAYRVHSAPHYLLRRVLSILQFLGITFIVTLTIICATLLPMLIDLSYYKLMYSKYIFLEFILFIIVSWLYFTLPNIKHSIINVFPGSFFVIINWTILAKVFKKYIQHFNQVNVIYGSLGGIVISLLFFYIISLIFICGANFNFRYEHSKTLKP